MCSVDRVMFLDSVPKTATLFFGVALKRYMYAQFPPMFSWLTHCTDVACPSVCHVGTVFTLRAM